MTIKNIKHDQQMITKLRSDLQFKLSNTENKLYAKMYADYNEAHAQVVEIESEVCGVWGNKNTRQTVKEVF